MVEFNEQKQLKRLTELKKREEEELTRKMAPGHGLEYKDLSVTPINIDALRIIKEKDAREAGIGVFNILNKNIDVAIISPNKVIH